ncbi:MAG: CobW family GTP-binding protein [Desulfitobacteriaceae bacterium]
MNNDNKCPVTIVTGFLGSGKTTLLGRLLSEPGLSGTAVLVNEFGKVGLDHSLLRRIDERTTLLGGGCVCCNMRDDLVQELKDLLNSYERGEIATLDRVIIETTGLADPAPILFTVLTDPLLMHHYYIDFVITAVDAVNGHLHLDKNSESLKQIVVADKIIVTKTDLVTREQIESLVARIRGINPSAQIIEAIHGHVDAPELFDNDKSDIMRQPLKRINQECALPTIHKHNDGTVRSIALSFDEPLDWIAFGLWLSMLLYARGGDVLRVKGLIDVGESGPVVLNGVQHIIHPPRHLEDWAEEEHMSKLVFIMKTIEPRTILHSLRAFQHVIGASPTLLEVKMGL